MKAPAFAAASLLRARFLGLHGQRGDLPGVDLIDQLQDLDGLVVVASSMPIRDVDMDRGSFAVAPGTPRRDRRAPRASSTG